MLTGKRAVIYCRVRFGAQTTENQLIKVREYVERRGYGVIAELSDGMGSGGGGKVHQPGFKTLCGLVARKQVDIILAYSVADLSPSVVEFWKFLQKLRTNGVDLFLLEQGFGTSSGTAMDLVVVFSKLEKAVAREKVLAGLEKARASGVRLGRPSRASSPKVIAEVKTLRSENCSIAAIARKLRIGCGTTQRILAGESDDAAS
jgi:DNA invertase Pin-like site-specific DNA recombinase